MAVMELQQEQTTATREVSTMNGDRPSSGTGRPTGSSCARSTVPTIERRAGAACACARRRSTRSSGTASTGPCFVRLSAADCAAKIHGGRHRPGGAVEAVGKDVTELRPGDEVFGTSGAAWAEYAVAREARLAREAGQRLVRGSGGRPDRGAHRLQALRARGACSPGQKVLINGASGGVGTFAVQLAKALGRDVNGGVQHEERRARPLARRRPRRRLHPGGLHAARASATT